MSFPDLQRTGDTTPERGTLFDSASRLARDAAASAVANRREKILRYLAERGPACLFEIAAHYGWFDHQVSGRFTELARDGLIERTGERRVRPDTNCVADVWRLRADDPPRREDLADKQGYPPSIFIPEEGNFVRAPMLASDNAPGIPYSLYSDSARLRLNYRVALIECDGCGRPVQVAVEKIDGKDAKVYRCGTPECNRTWHLALVNEAGRSPMLALVMKRF